MGTGIFNPGIGFPDIMTGQGNLSPAYSFSCQATQLEVDRETGKVKILEIIGAHDCGFAINPMAVEGQLEGSVASSLGHAIYEELIRDKGQTMNPSFLDYRIPTAIDMPEVKPIIIQTPDPKGPFGAKESGEGANLAIPPAIASAVHDAVGIRIFHLPITLEKILEALEKRGNEGRGMS